MISLATIIGHRGAAAQVAENTLASFDRAAELGATWIELDVRLTGDGKLAVFHDATLERTTNGRGRLDETDSHALCRLDAGGGEPVPLLDQALALARHRRLGVNIEIKGKPESARQTATALTEALTGHDEPILISSFKAAFLTQTMVQLPHLPRGLLFKGLPADWQAQAQSLGAASIHCRNREITQGQVEAIKTEGYLCAIYTVNDPQRAEILWSWGVDSVFSDLPPPMAALLRNNR